MLAEVTCNLCQKLSCSCEISSNTSESGSNSGHDFFEKKIGQSTYIDCPPPPPPTTPDIKSKFTAARISIPRSNDPLIKSNYIARLYSFLDKSRVTRYQFSFEISKRQQPHFHLSVEGISPNKFRTLLKKAFPELNGNKGMSVKQEYVDNLKYIMKGIYETKESEVETYGNIVMSDEHIKQLHDQFWDDRERYESDKNTIFVKEKKYPSIIRQIQEQLRDLGYVYVPDRLPDQQYQDLTSKLAFSTAHRKYHYSDRMNGTENVRKVHQTLMQAYNSSCYYKLYDMITNEY